VLYVEDNTSNVRLMQRIMERRPGVRLLHGPTGGEGLTLARRERPDLIFLDMHLPDMSGEDVLHRLWQDAALRSIPVAVLSADAAPSGAEAEDGRSDRVLDQAAGCACRAQAARRATLRGVLEVADVPEVDVVHRLKNHIAIIVGFADLLLQETPKDDPRHADIEEIQKAAYAAMAIMPEIGPRAPDDPRRV
ncbi:MAG TPA: response regulator, partial [Vicinamibacterales bacterium]|nr:response regulator [Vicinamibacterales bacterium]